MPKEMIHAEKLIYEYDKRDEEGNIIGAERAIDGVDIDVPQGSFVAILGHNGSGKSTLAKHMNAILVPTGGTMWVDGRDTKDPGGTVECAPDGGYGYSRIRTTRSSEPWWRKMWDLVLKTWESRQTRSGSG